MPGKPTSLAACSSEWAAWEGKAAALTMRIDSRGRQRTSLASTEVYRGFDIQLDLAILQSDLSANLIDHDFKFVFERMVSQMLANLSQLSSEEGKTTGKSIK